MAVKYKAGFWVDYGEEEIVTVFAKDVFFNSFELEVKGLFITEAIDLVDSINRGRILSKSLLNQDRLSVKVTKYFLP